MAEELTEADIVYMQNRLADEHRLELAAIAALTLVELNNLFMAVMSESRSVFAAAVRETVPEIMQAYGPSATQLSSNFYQNSREVYQLSGRAPANITPFVPKPVEFLQTPRPLEIIDTSMNEVGYWLGQAFEGDFTPQKIITPTKQIVQKSVFDFSRQAIIVDMGADPFAQETATRKVKSGGCAWCKHMAYQVGGEEIYFKEGNQPEWRKDSTFHKGCGCVMAPAFRDEYENRPEWADDWEDQYEKARREIMDHNASLNATRVEYWAERVNSKGKLVREKKHRYEYHDASGKPAERQSVTVKNILSKIRKEDRAA